MVDVNKFTLYCAGKNYVINKKVDAALAEERFGNRVSNDMTEQLMRGAQHQADKTAANQFVQRQLPNLPRPVARFVNVMARFGQAVANMVQNAARQLQQLPDRLMQGIRNFGQRMAQGLNNTFNLLAGNILGQFFGFKKANDKVEEREDREQQDLAGSDLFSAQKVNASEGTNLGQGS